MSWLQIPQGLFRDRNFWFSIIGMTIFAIVLSNILAVILFYLIDFKEWKLGIICAFVIPFFVAPIGTFRIFVLSYELEKAKEKLEHLNKELEQFAYVASHDLQEPLRMVASFTQLLERKYKDQLDDQAKEYINFAVDGAERMQVLIDDLLSFSRLGQKDIPRKNVDLNRICKQILTDMKIKITENQATVTIDPLPTLHANETQMTQLFLNLISNGIKYRSDRSPIIKVTSTKIGKNQWQFAVSDNGIGIDAKYYDKLFVIFQRLHTKKEYKGTGIGLALCKKIVENYDGRIWVESKVDEGTIFNFILNEGNV